MSEVLAGRSNSTRLLKRFTAALTAVDAAALREILTNDFEWHMHHTSTPSDLLASKVLRGVDALISELEWRQKHWSRQRTHDVVERVFGDHLIQIFRLEGIDQNGKPFSWQVVDFHNVRDGRISKKETYWRQMPIR